MWDTFVNVISVVTTTRKSVDLKILKGPGCTAVRRTAYELTAVRRTAVRRTAVRQYGTRCMAYGTVCTVYGNTAYGTLYIVAEKPSSQDFELLANVFLLRGALATAKP